MKHAFFNHTQLQANLLSTGNTKFFWLEPTYLDPSGWQEQVCPVGRPAPVEPSSVTLGQRHFCLKEGILLTFALLFLKAIRNNRNLTYC